MNILEKINVVRNELVVGKDATNAHKKYDYFSPDSVNKALQPLLSQHKLFDRFELLWNPEKGLYEAIYTLYDTENATPESIQNIVFRFDIKTADIAGANGAQESGGTLTYAKRYSQMNAFNIADNNIDLDNDKFNKGMKKPQPQHKKASVQPQPASNSNGNLATDPQLRLLEKLQKDGKVPENLVFAEKTKIGKFENIKITKEEASTVIQEAKDEQPISWGGSEEQLPF